MGVRSWSDTLRSGMLSLVLLPAASRCFCFPGSASGYTCRYNLTLASDSWASCTYCERLSAVHTFKRAAEVEAKQVLFKYRRWPGKGWRNLGFAVGVIRTYFSPGFEIWRRMGQQKKKKK